MPITKEQLAQRIRAVREGCGLTQEQLGASAGMQRLAITQIENGSRTVSSIELDKIAHAVGLDLRSFFTDRFEGQDALLTLYSSDERLGERPDLLAALRDSLALGREMSNLERLLAIGRTQQGLAAYPLPMPSSRWEAIRQGQRVASEERQRLGYGSAPVRNLVDVFESQAVRVGAVPLPDKVSGLTLWDPTDGIFVAINRDHSMLRRRFSMAHEYAHVLIDSRRPGAVSHSDNRADLLEVRANAFAAEFLMPAEGVLQFMQALGKGGASRAQVTVYDEMEVLQVEQRLPPGSQDIQLYDVALLGHHFGTSRPSAVYRLRNLKLLDERELGALRTQDDSAAGKAMAELLAVEPSTIEPDSSDDFRRRFLGLALEAHRRDEITQAKLTELAAMVGATPRELKRATASTPAGRS